MTNQRGVVELEGSRLHFPGGARDVDRCADLLQIVHAYSRPQIMLHVVAGRLNKQIANDIGIAESTVKVHRTNLMRKMKARSLPELSRMADTLNMRPQQP